MVMKVMVNHIALFYKDETINYQYNEDLIYYLFV